MVSSQPQSQPKGIFQPPHVKRRRFQVTIPYLQTRRRGEPQNIVHSQKYLSVREYKISKSHQTPRSFPPGWDIAPLGQRFQYFVPPMRWCLSFVNIARLKLNIPGTRLPAPSPVPAPPHVATPRKIDFLFLQTTSRATFTFPHSPTWVEATITEGWVL